MHREVREFCSWVKDAFPLSFKDVKVLDVGSLDVCGNNKELFEESKYTGIDVVKGANVDRVCKCHLMKGKFDTIISTEAFEHDKYLEKSLKNICKMLKTRGLFVFTCATTGRAEHGTTAHHPSNSGTSQIKGWCDYYKNVTQEMVEPIIKDYFGKYEFKVVGRDLQFWGIRNGKEVE